MNPLSNLHLCEFEHNGIIFHGCEQLIQYMKAVYFDDEPSVRAILNSDSALECKHLSRNIVNFNREEWMKVTREMCDVGIYEKFKQNPSIGNLLLSTGNQTIVEACKVKDWGSGMLLYDERCLVKSTWYSQGLLGTILEEVRAQLKSDIEGGNEPDEPADTVNAMETESEGVVGPSDLMEDSQAAL